MEWLQTFIELCILHFQQCTCDGGGHKVRTPTNTQGGTIEEKIPITIRALANNFGREVSGNVLSLHTNKGVILYDMCSCQNAQLSCE